MVRLFHCIYIFRAALACLVFFTYQKLSSKQSWWGVILLLILQVNFTLTEYWYFSVLCRNQSCLPWSLIKRIWKFGVQIIFYLCLLLLLVQERMKKMPSWFVSGCPAPISCNWFQERWKMHVFFSPYALLADEFVYFPPAQNCGMFGPPTTMTRRTPSKKMYYTKLMNPWTKSNYSEKENPMILSIPMDWGNRLMIFPSKVTVSIPGDIWSIPKDVCPVLNDTSF